MICQNVGCANEVPPKSKKFCSKRCKHQVACRASRARKIRGLAEGTKITKFQSTKRRAYKRHVKTIDASTPRRDGRCHMCSRKAIHGRGLYCSDECRVKAARAKYNARRLAKA